MLENVKDQKANLPNIIPKNDSSLIIVNHQQLIEKRVSWFCESIFRVHVNTESSVAAWFELNIRVNNV